VKIYFILLVGLFFVSTSLSSCAVFQTSSNVDSNKTETIIVVEFYSKGAGIDFKSKKMLEEFIVSYQESNKVLVEYNTSRHGKEGEINYIFNVEKLSKKERKKFKEALKENLKNATNIRVS